MRELHFSVMRADIFINISCNKGAKFFCFLSFLSDSSKYQFSEYYNFFKYFLSMQVFLFSLK